MRVHIELGASDRADASTVDERWAAWVAPGMEHDRRTKMRAIAAAAVVAGALGLWQAEAGRPYQLAGSGRHGARVNPATCSSSS
jgi:hypothetical protein